MAFSLLHPEVQRWVYDQGWTELRAAQREAVAPILAGDADVIITAATGSGKTEAAYLPILSALAATGPPRGIGVLYLSPLKALINDQFERLGSLCERLDIPLHRWHGDVPDSQKAKMRKDPSGVLLTTPESLEARFVLEGSAVAVLFANLRYLIIDELHSFIGTERGAQLQCLAHRLELAVRRRIPRIALSATLGDMAMAAEFLRPGACERVRIIEADDDGGEVRLQLHGYVISAPSPDGAQRPDRVPSAGDAAVRQEPGPSEPAIAQHLFDTLRGTDNLIFANSRQKVELYADRLARLSERARVPNEFFAHHGSLSADLRHDVETRLKDRALPVNAVCTSTLEMGIDIGDVRSIAQIGAPPSVSSTRQRLGRSGRRGDPAILRVYISEHEVQAQTSPPDALRAELIQTVAMVNLLLGRWYEPPIRGELHLSTLVQQLLSMIAQHGGVQPNQAYSALCGHGPFTNLSARQFGVLVGGLRAKDVIAIASDGLLLLGQRGEQIVNHYSFYAAFTTPKEWRLASSGRQLGTLPVNGRQPMLVGGALVFAGRRWQIVAVDPAHKVVDLVPASGGTPPRFSGVGPLVHDRVRQEMHGIYRDAAIPAYLDATAVDLLLEGRQNFLRYRLDETQVITSGTQTYVFLWAGDRIMYTVAAALIAEDVSASHDGLALSVADVSASELIACLCDLAGRAEPDPVALARAVGNKAVEKYDALVPGELLDMGHAARTFDCQGAWNSLRALRDRTQ